MQRPVTAIREAFLASVVFTQALSAADQPNIYGHKQTADNSNLYLIDLPGVPVTVETAYLHTGQIPNINDYNTATRSSLFSIPNTRGIRDFAAEITPALSKNDVVNWERLRDNSSGKTHIVKSKSSFLRAASSAHPGDVILVQSGTYDWDNLAIASNGTDTHPIVYTTLEPGTVTFQNSEVLFDITGNWNIIGGYTVANNNRHVFRLSNASNNRITGNELISPGEYGGWEGYIELTNRSHNNRIDHNIILKPKAPIRILLDEEAVKTGASLGNRFDHNRIIGVRPGDHYVNLLQIGQGTESVPGSSSLKTNTVFEFNEVRNYFGNTSQLINNKSGHNIYRYNTFINCQGGIGLREGDRNFVYGNYFERCGNVMVKGTHNVIFDNIIVNGGAIYESMWGNRPFAGSKTPPTGQNLVASNTIVNISRAGISLGMTSGGSNKQVYESVYINNVLIGNVGTLFRFNILGCVDCVIADNKYCASGKATRGAGYFYDVNPIKVCSGNVDPGT
jgi:poly(beta-D-mannuronate) lyase